MNEIFIGGIIGLIIGIIIGRFILNILNKRAISSAKVKADLLIRSAEEKAQNIKKEKILEAKERYLQIKSDFEQKSGIRKQKLQADENSLRKEKGQFDQRVSELNKKDQALKEIKDND